MPQQMTGIRMADRSSKDLNILSCMAQSFEVGLFQHRLPVVGHLFQVFETDFHSLFGQRRVVHGRGGLLDRVAQDVFHQAYRALGLRQAASAVVLLFVDDQPGEAADGVCAWRVGIGDGTAGVLRDFPCGGRDAFGGRGYHFAALVAHVGIGDFLCKGIFRPDVADGVRSLCDDAGHARVAFGGLAHGEVHCLPAAIGVFPRFAHFREVIGEDERRAAAVRAVGLYDVLGGQRGLRVQFFQARVVPLRDFAAEDVGNDLA